MVAGCDSSIICSGPLPGTAESNLMNNAIFAAVLAQATDGAASAPSLFSRIWSAVTFIWAHRPETLLVSMGLIALLALLSRVPVSYNVLNLIVRWRTAALTVSAFVAVVGLLVVMLAFVNGMYRL